ncbi:hypothetical protein NEMBOFW57_009468 [Staphylotrichum longicolle]|uniref:Uncharacterized protein n=1 Tax=Staphylotrichum longicolle TaxID=669026 RepID=A0AAD4HXS8_9PEZI|nr:hypothetical protein NEMBOFW57_009468 [Staphylotrichum longicolle]
MASRRIFASLFWTLILAIVVIRITIAITRVRLIVGGGSGLQDTVNHLHMAYFPLIAVLECVSAYYLLTSFSKAKINSLKCVTKTGLFRFLMRSTEVRLALLAVVGIIRAVTYSFQATAQSATYTASQVDRFAYTLESLFPIMMLRHFVSGGREEVAFTPNQHVVEVHGGAADSGYGRTSSQERIIRPNPFGTAASDADLDAIDAGQVGISKTVEFEVEVSESRSEARSPSA